MCRTADFAAQYLALKFGIPKEFLRDPAEVEAIRQSVREQAAKQEAEEAKKPRVSSAYLFGYCLGRYDAELQKGYRDGFREGMK